MSNNAAQQPPLRVPSNLLSHLQRWFVSQESCDVFLQGMQAAGVMSGGGSSYEPQQGRNHYPLKCATGNASTNGESCYGLVGTDWHPGPACDGYPSCNFTALGRKPAFDIVKDWAKRLAAPSWSTGSFTS